MAELIAAANAPKIMTGLLPTKSASFPLKGLLTAAVKAKSDMIKPLYSAPPI